jgi:integrase
MRAVLLDQGKHRDAAMVSVMAYAGLRPSEMLALRWDAVRERTILVDRAAGGHGDVKATKGSGRVRTVRLLAPLAADLAAWRLASPQAADRALVFSNSAGQVWSDGQWTGWHRTHFNPAKRHVGAFGARPYDLRHSFVSLLIFEGLSIIEVARQAGHSPTMTLEVYGHVFDEFNPADRLPAEEQSGHARENLGVRIVSASEVP